MGERETFREQRAHNCSLFCVLTGNIDINPNTAHAAPAGLSAFMPNSELTESKYDLKPQTSSACSSSFSGLGGGSFQYQNPPLSSAINSVGQSSSSSSAFLTIVQDPYPPLSSSPELFEPHNKSLKYSGNPDEMINFSQQTSRDGSSMGSNSFLNTNNKFEIPSSMINEQPVATNGLGFNLAESAAAAAASSSHHDLLQNSNGAGLSHKRSSNYDKSTDDMMFSSGLNAVNLRPNNHLNCERRWQTNDN